MECYTQTGFGQHGQVIRSVSYSNSLCYVHTFYLSDQFQQFGIDYVYANELEIVNGKLTGRYLGDVVDGKRKAEIGESTG